MGDLIRGPKTRSLITALDELSTLLASHGENHWSSWLASDLSRIRAGDFAGITHLLSAYGGMGSFNDLVLHAANGHVIDEGDVARVNTMLSSLRNRAWSLATEIERGLT